MLVELYQMRTTLEEVLTDFAPGSAPVLDALSGQPLSQLPAGVKPATVPVASPEESEQAAKSLQDLLLQANELTRETEVLYEKQIRAARSIFGTSCRKKSPTEHRQTSRRLAALPPFPRPLAALFHNLLSNK